MKNIRERIILLISFLFFLSNIVFSKNKPIIAVSINPVKLVVKEIVKEKMQIYNIVPPGASPHTFQLTIKNRLIIKNADLLVIIGANLENWLINLKQGFRKQGKLFVFSDYTTDFIGEKNNPNPHIWLSIKRVIKILPYLKDAVIKTDPGNKKYYLANYNRFLNDLNRFDKLITSETDKIKNKNIVVYHPVWNYFLKDYKFNIIANIERKPGEIPTLKRMMNIISLIKNNDVRIIIVEPGTSLKWAKTIAKQTNTKTTTLDPLGFFNKIKTYEDLIFINFKTLIKALKR